jgi:hypothetical protein
MVARASQLSTGGGNIEDRGQLKRCSEEERGPIHGLKHLGICVRLSLFFWSII